MTTPHLRVARQTLHRVLDRSLAYAASYPAGSLQLSNHLPMALTALWQLGAPADALEATAQRAAWLSIGRPAADFDAVHVGSADETTWQAALPALATTPDEHRVKLAWTALDEWRHRGWSGYARVLPTQQEARA